MEENKEDPRRVVMLTMKEVIKYIYIYILSISYKVFVFKKFIRLRILKILLSASSIILFSILLIVCDWVYRKVFRYRYFSQYLFFDCCSELFYIFSSKKIRGSGVHLKKEVFFLIKKNNKEIIEKFIRK